MFMIASLIVFLIYFANVASGALLGLIYLGDVGEMLVLFAATILFVVAILQKEAAGKKKNDG
jgi:hypothetical protein